jgi:mRNA interferase RelE/StbE
LPDYRIFETRTFQKDLEDIRKAGFPGLREKLRDYIYPRLAEHPHSGPNIKRLVEWNPPTWRYRVGAWRFFYELDERSRVVLMTVAEHRGRAYR